MSSSDPESSSSEAEETTNADDTRVLGYKVNFLKPLGRGGFGTVYKGVATDGSVVAMKMLSKKSGTATSREAVRSHYMMNKINHNNVVKIYDVKSYEDSMWIFMEYCRRGDLNYFLKDKNKATLDKFMETVVPDVMRDIANGLAFLHNKDIVHRDIKPANILLKKFKNKNGFRAKLADFGLSKILDPEDETSAMSSNVGTMAFKAPEFWDRKPGRKVHYHRNVDVYAAGLTFAAMLQAKPGQNLIPKPAGPLKRSETNMEIGLIAFTRRADVDLVGEMDDLDDELVSLIQDMTRTSPHDRISADETLERLQVD